MLGKPVVMNYRSGEAPDHLKRSRVARATLRGVDQNAVPSRFLHEVFASFGVRSEIIPNIVDVERFRFRRREQLRPHLLSTRNSNALQPAVHPATRLIQTAAQLTLVAAVRRRRRRAARGRTAARERRLPAVPPDDDGALLKPTSTCRHPTSTT
jgi:glycosyltransferase involved in cell wall biosynthesis